MGAVDFSHFAPGGFNRRFEAGRIGFNRFGPNRFDRFGSNRFSFNRFNRFGFNRFGGNSNCSSAAGVGAAGAASPIPAASEPIIVGDGAPVIINIGVDPGAGDAGAAYRSGGCVIHKLNYDSNGKYVGERQIPHC